MTLRERGWAGRQAAEVLPGAAGESGESPEALAWATGLEAEPSWNFLYKVSCPQLGSCQHPSQALSVLRLRLSSEDTSGPALPPPHQGLTLADLCAVPEGCLSPLHPGPSRPLPHPGSGAP